MCSNIKMNVSWFERSMNSMPRIHWISALFWVCFWCMLQSFYPNLPQIEGRQKNWYQPQGRLLAAGEVMWKWCFHSTANPCHETVEAIWSTIEAITPMTPVYSEDMSCRNFIPLDVQLGCGSMSAICHTKCLFSTPWRICGQFVANLAASIYVPSISTAPPRELSLALGELHADRFPPEIYAEIGNQSIRPSLTAGILEHLQEGF